MSPLPLTNNTAIGDAAPATSEPRRPSCAPSGWRVKRRPFVSGGVDLRKKRARLGQRGAVMVELLIAYIPVLFCFLAFWQLSELLVAQMVVARASSAAGRAAVVVFPDDPMFYAGEAKNTLGGKRQGDVRLAAGMMLAASPHLGEDFEVLVGDLPEDVGVVELTVVANFRCDRLRFVCGADGVVGLRATSSHTYHGAKYQYEPTDLSSAASGDLFASGDASCKDGDPASNGTGGKGGKGGDGSGSNGSGSNGSGGRGNGGSGGRGNGGSSGSGGEGSTRGGDLCGRGSQQNSDGTCSPKNCTTEKDSKKRKQCEDDCPTETDVRDEIGQCCKSLKRVKLENGKPADRCEEPKLQCVNQESATGQNGHSLTGTITAGDTTLNLPDIAPDFKEICGDASKCSATGGNPTEDIGVKIVANLKLKQMEAWCKEEGGSRKAKVEQIKTEWNDWAKTFRTYWLGSPAGKEAVDKYLASHPDKTEKDAKSAVWGTKKNQLDKERDTKAAAGTSPKPGEGGNTAYKGPNAKIDPFFKALDTWCDALEAAKGSVPLRYEKFSTPEVQAAEKEMLKNLQSMPKTIQNSVAASLMNQTGSNHTEAKVIELLEGWSKKYKQNLKDMDVHMELTGDWSPCTTCTQRLKDFVEAYGGTVKYCWTKGIYTTGVGRNDSFVQGGGELISGTIKHKGCVEIGPTGPPKFTSSAKLCKKGEKNGRPASSF
jgi:hypothetical protein